MGYIDLVEFLIILALIVASWFFRSRACAMENYVEVHRATREFVDVVMISLEDLVITDEESDEIREKCVTLVTAIAAFIAALDDGADPDDALEESIVRIME